MVTIEVTLTTETPLNIGSGAQQGSLADRAMIKDRQGWPYVPASALKGRLRHAVEQVALALGLEVCETNRDMCLHHDDVCRVCRIFGSPWYPGRLRFSRLTLSGPESLVRRLKDSRGRPRTTLRYGVAISRRRGVAENALLYTTELFEPGAALMFTGQLTGDLDPEEVILVLAGLQSIPALGRGKSGGLGWGEFQADVTGAGTDQLQTPAGRRALLESLKA